jgi:hypothetical protein
MCLKQFLQDVIYPLYKKHGGDLNSRSSLVAWYYNNRVLVLHLATGSGLTWEDREDHIINYLGRWC